jgi:PTH1 family peptidyl-tRNA hydrolase
MLLLVGLGNPGRGHARNRHNIGFLALDEIIRRHSFGPARRRFQGLVAEGSIAGEKVLALKPQTFMNHSGRSVGEAVRFYKLPLREVVVFHDELDLAPGRIKVKLGGGVAGHNGLKSIAAHLGRDFRRVRLGIGHPGDRDRVTPYVLKDFAKADNVWVGKLIDAVAEAVPYLVEGDDAGFMTKVALILNPPKPKPKPKPEEVPATSAPAGEPDGV